MLKRTRKKVPWAGWSKLAPSAKERTIMQRVCGKKCFLGPDKSFPICAKRTCKINTKGVYSAYIRAKSHAQQSKKSKYTNIARKAKHMLRKLE
jgi:hypothetical protein